jgi:hypothetical protein
MNALTTSEAFGLLAGLVACMFAIALYVKATR